MAMFLGKKKDDRLLPIEGAPRRKRTNYFTFPCFKTLKQLSYTGIQSKEKIKENILSGEDVFYPDPVAGPDALLRDPPLTPGLIFENSDADSDFEDPDISPGGGMESPIKPQRAQPLGERCSTKFKRSSSSTETAPSGGSGTSSGDSDLECSFFEPPPKRPASLVDGPLICKRRCALDESPKIENLSGSSSCGSSTSTDSFEFVNTRDTCSGTSCCQGGNPSANEVLGKLNLQAEDQDHSMRETPPLKGGEDYTWPWN
ncbi:orf45 [Alcelaphine gammaherpesvirus 2]|uniref:Orf45 n=1 Tax=Alcelaphine gammaherpesvirus 2 TaxID=138184 RepID=A0A068AAL3_9GAMA|nr:orf45 [Alcelaphine gammaherpesvirus 2]AIA62081.1 orf45 [Alcelaphine gammaherpesvirus 2]